MHLRPYFSKSNLSIYIANKTKQPLFFFPIYRFLKLPTIYTQINIVYRHFNLSPYKHCCLNITSLCGLINWYLKLHFHDIYLIEATLIAPVKVQRLNDSRSINVHLWSLNVICVQHPTVSPLLLYYYMHCSHIWELASRALMLKGYNYTVQY